MFLKLKFPEITFNDEFIDGFLSMLQSLESEKKVSTEYGIHNSSSVLLRTQSNSLHFCILFEVLSGEVSFFFSQFNEKV